MSAKKTKTTKRIMKGTSEIYSDLFKLDVALMKKNISWSEVPDYVNVEHCHFFHTVDSSGIPQYTSTKIGGHYHKMEIIPSATKEDPPTVKCVSGPLKKVKQKQRGRLVTVEVPAEEEDYHTHEVTYLSSETVQIRRMKPEIINMQAVEANKIAPIPGVIS